MTEDGIGRRLWRIGRWVLLALALLPLVFWLGLATALKLTQLEDYPFTEILGITGSALGSMVTCGLFGCEPELLDGMETIVFDATLLEGTPVALDVDEYGRVLVAETSRQDNGAQDNRNHPYWLEDDLASRTVDDRRAYYRKWIEAGEISDPELFTRAADRLVALVDEDRDGVADRRDVLAEWSEMASGLVAGVEARAGEIYVTSIPSVYRVLDRNHDGQAEAVETLHTGFGVKTSLIGHDLHGLVWGPDGRLYFSVGDRGYHVETPDGRVLAPDMGPGRGAVFRMRPDGSELEVFATGVRNPQELAFDDYGNLLTGDNNGDGGDAARIVYLVEGGETGWAMPYQTLVGDYVRGPWVAERLWDLQHDSQPAWVLPPIAHMGNGPAGFVHYPGLGLPERYSDHFFLCDYAYTPGRSGIWSFAVEPAGAGLKLVDRHPFIWSVLATDVDFDWRGDLFATLFDQFGGGQEVVSWRHQPTAGDPRRSEALRWARRPLASEDTSTLVGLLAFPDQRLRLRAQYALAERGAGSGARAEAVLAALVAQARSAETALVPRLHALWGLGQIGPAAVERFVAASGPELGAEPSELRAQLARVAGDARASSLAPTLRGWLADPSRRVRFFAAQALGALGDVDAITPLLIALDENADRDVFLRHAIVWALHRIGDREAVYRRRDDPVRALRMGALLVLRHADDPRIAHFLQDPDPLIVVEAARAIYDRPIDGAMPALAALLPTLEPAPAADRQTARALHRRAIGANVRLRSAAGAGALARYAADERQLEALRRLALDALGRYDEPPPRDLTSGFHRPLPPAPRALLARVFESDGRALIDSDLGAEAIEIANRVGVLPLADDELVARAGTGEPAERAAALTALARRAEAGSLSVDSDGAIAEALRAPSAIVRNAGRDLARVVSPGAGLAALIDASTRGPDRADRQHAWQRLGAIAAPEARAAIAAGLDAYERGEGDPGAALELLEAARRQGGGLAARAQAHLVPVESPEAPVALRVEARRWALEGGDPVAGRAVFQTTGDCQRCHGGTEGHGGGVGPPLDHVGDRGAAHVLASMLVPNAEIAEGYETVLIERRGGGRVTGLLVEQDDRGLLRVDTGGGRIVTLEAAEVAARRSLGSGMPPMGLALPPRALRDVVAYVMTLE